MNYFNKYLKYKKKYLIIKQKAGAEHSIIKELNFDILPDEFKNNDLPFILDYSKNLQDIVDNFNYGTLTLSVLEDTKPNIVESFTREISSNKFSSLYRYNTEGELCLAKSTEMIRSYIIVFDGLCKTKDFHSEKPLFPKMRTNFYLFRGEYYDDFYKFRDSVVIGETRKYHAPFSTSYNFDFAFNWVGSQVLYIINVPYDCNYLYFSEKFVFTQKDPQYEVALQQGIITYTKIYYVNREGKRKLIIECDFNPTHVDHAIEELPPQCV